MLDVPPTHPTSTTPLEAAVVRAVRRVLRFVNEEGTRPAYISRTGAVAATVNKAGWPSTVRASSVLSNDGPINWARVLDTVKTPLLNITPDDVPELREVIALVAADVPLGERLRSVVADIPDENRRENRFAQECLHLLASVLAQVNDSNAASDEQILNAWRLVANAEAAASLRYDLLVPLPLLAFPDDFSLALEDQVKIRPMTEDEQVARAPGTSSVAEVNPYIVAAATHCLILENRSVDNSPGAFVRSVRMSVETADIEIIERVCQALHISLSKGVGYAQVCLLPRGWVDRWSPSPSLSKIKTYRRFPPAFERAAWNRQKAALEDGDLALIERTYHGLSKGSRQARLAAQRLFLASLRADRDDSLLDSCIGIEALLGEGKDELVHRMSLRAATALAASSRYHSPQVSYKLMKEVYKLRSQLVHGVNIKDRMIQVDSNSIPATDAARYLLRWLLRALFESEPAWDPIALDRRLLAALETLRADGDG